MGCRIFPTLRRGSDFAESGVRPRAASRVLMPVAAPAYPAVQAAQGLRRESRRGRRGRVPKEHVHPRVDQRLRRLHAWNAEEPPASKSTRRKLPTVPDRPGRVRTSQPRRMPPPVACQNTTAGPCGRPAPRERFEGNGIGHGARARRNCEPAADVAALLRFNRSSLPRTQSRQCW